MMYNDLINSGTKIDYLFVYFVLVKGETEKFKRRRQNIEMTKTDGNLRYI